MKNSGISARYWTESAADPDFPSVSELSAGFLPVQDRQDRLAVAIRQLAERAIYLDSPSEVARPGAFYRVGIVEP